MDRCSTSSYLLAMNMPVNPRSIRSSFLTLWRQMLKYQSMMNTVKKRVSCSKYYKGLITWIFISLSFVFINYPNIIKITFVQVNSFLRIKTLDFAT
jgi:hypothetical protein